MVSFPSIIFRNPISVIMFPERHTFFILGQIDNRRRMTYAERSVSWLPERFKNWIFSALKLSQKKQKSSSNIWKLPISSFMSDLILTTALMSSYFNLKYSELESPKSVKTLKPILSSFNIFLLLSSYIIMLAVRILSCVASNPKNCSNLFFSIRYSKVFYIWSVILVPEMSSFTS